MVDRGSVEGLGLAEALGRHTGEVDAVAGLPDGRVVSGGDDRVLIWNAATQRQVAQLGCSVMGLAAGQASSRKAFLVVAHRGQGLSLWSIPKDGSEQFFASKLNP